MALSYHIDPSAKQARIVGKGSFSMPEMIAVVDQVAEDSRFRSDFTVVLDIRDAEYAAQIDDGDEFAAALKRRAADFRNRFALVVPESLHFLATLYCVVAKVAGVERMQCFTGMDEALAWCREAPQPPASG